MAMLNNQRVFQAPKKLEEPPCVQCMSQARSVFQGISPGIWRFSGTSCTSWTAQPIGIWQHLTQALTVLGILSGKDEQLPSLGVHYNQILPKETCYTYYRAFVLQPTLCMSAMKVNIYMVGLPSYNLAYKPHNPIKCVYIYTVYIYVCMYVCMHACMHACMYVYLR